MSRFQEKTVTELREIKDGLNEIDRGIESAETNDALDAVIEEIDAVVEEKSAAATAEVRHRIFQALRGAFLQTATAVPGTDEDEFSQTAYEVVQGLTPEEVDAACEGTLTE